MVNVEYDVKVTSELTPLINEDKYKLKDPEWCGSIPTIIYEVLPYISECCEAITNLSTVDESVKDDRLKVIHDLAIECQIVLDGIVEYNKEKRDQAKGE